MNSSDSAPAEKWRRAMGLTLGGAWILFQLLNLFDPLAPLVAHPIHLTFALGLGLLWRPLSGPRGRVFDVALLLGVVVVGGYYLVSLGRLSNRIDGVDEVTFVDLVCGILLIVLLLEAVRRIVGWSLLGVILAFLTYAFVGPWLPGWLGFSGFGFIELVEILTMTLYGILGITTETSVQFVFYFVMFGAVYGAIGGGRLLIDLTLSVTGGRQGGSAQAAVAASSLMGAISGSAVTNVSATGVFTIPLMRQSGYSATRAAAIEAMASTGGQLMPPVMGVAAFVIAEMLQIEYSQVALAGLAPAVAFYVALFVVVHLESRRDGVGHLDAGRRIDPLAPRLHLLIPPIALIAFLVAGFSASLSATFSTGLCVVVCYLRGSTALKLRDWRSAIEDGSRQAALVAAPIAAIGVIIAVAVQSNLALKFSTQLIAQAGGGLPGALGVIALGCLIMGAGLPTVAAYIIGAILFAPALIEFGVNELAAHLFVMYYCVLSMVTPPVALASYAAAGIAGASTMSTSLDAFRLSAVSFVIPIAFVLDPRVLGQGSALWVLLAFASLTVATAGWAIALAGWWRRPLRLLERAVLAALAIALIVSPTGTGAWAAAAIAFALGILWLVLSSRST